MSPALVIGLCLASTVIGGLAALGLTWAMRALDAYIDARAEAVVKNIFETRAAAEPPAPKDDLEGALIGFGKLRELVNEYDARLAHVTAGGRWDDSPTKWKKGSKA